MGGVQKGFGMTPAGATDPIIKGVGGDFATAH